MSWQQRWMKPRAAAAERQFAVFSLGDLEYALDIMHISQIIQPRPIRPFPRTPDFIDGVIELRGVVIPIMDLRRRFGLEAVSATRTTKFIIVRLARRFIGIVVDRVIGVHRVNRSAIRPPPRWIAGSEAAVFSGVCRRGDNLVLLVDLDALVSSEEKLHLGDLRLSDADYPAEAPVVETAEVGGAGDDVDDWWESE